ncbi:MAG: tetraacyldisaccharide 4'-kinase [Candidatus Hydrogenedentes bacterium]|nr:tetraacyldisaccharide 4'-kinase [Candidatus Hydrogenedentota bacterium]
MTLFDSLSDKIRNNEPIPWYLDALLSAATPVYRAGMLVRAMSTPVKVNARVISFGNLTVGGTGKTPAVIERAEAEVAAGNRVAVLTRGYGATQRLNETICVRGSDANAKADIIGDEPAMIARRVQNVIVARSADRVASARKAIDEFGCNVLILDDGYQYLRLARDENVLVIDATNPFGNGRLLPRGILREPVAAAARATHVILTHCDRAPVAAIEGLADHLDQSCPSAPIRTTRHAPGPLRSLATGEELPLETLNGLEIIVACAIARPESFAATLESLGARIAERRYYRDHTCIPDDALQGNKPVLVTEKDAARISESPPNVQVLGVRLADCAVPSFSRTA